MKFDYSNILARLKVLFRRLFIISGIIFLLFVVFAFTSGPFWLYYHLGIKNTEFDFKPECLVLLGGSGMPSESNLIRAYYASEAAAMYPGIPVIVALPGDTADSASAVSQLAKEIEERGVTQKRILFEPEGLNTRAQALNIYHLLSDTAENTGLVIVTSPEHMRRSLLSFRKAGFKYVGGCPAFEYAIESDITVNRENLGGNRLIPDVNKSISLRYRFWTHLKYEVLIMREYFALGYYMLKGWI